MTVKRILSMALVFCLCLTMLPTITIPTEAATPGYTVSSSYKASSYYSALCNVTLTGNQRTDIVNIALSQVGYREGSYSGDYGGADDGSYNNYTEYNYWYHNYVNSGMPVGGDSAPWCATFVSWCAEQANIPSSILKRSTVAGHGASYFDVKFYSGSSTLASSGDNDSYFMGYNYTPKAGDLFFTRSWSHVGIVVAVNGSYVITVEGNTNTNGSSQGNGVYRLTSRRVSDLYFGVPNYTNTSVKHTVDTSFGTNFTAYPKAKITAENIFDKYHSQIDSTSWIGTSDKCTIHEVYTDGCCRVTYPLDAGGTKEVYSKISLFNINTHTHSYTGSRYYESAHPHAITQRCVDYATCGGWIYTGEYYEKNTCEQCWYADFDVGASSVSVKVGESKSVALSVSGCWPDSAVADPSFSPDNDVAEVAVKNQQAIFTGLKEGTTLFQIRIYSDSSKSYLIGATSIRVDVACPTYTIAYNANGGSGAPGSQTKYHNTTLALSNIEPTRTGYTFLGWSTNSTATSASYQSGGSFTSNANTTLYAVWKANTYTVTYNANGGTGAPSSQTKTHGVSLTLSTTKPTKTGYTFLGWSTSSTATSATYQPGGSFTSNANTTLYAVWKANTTVLSVNASNSAVISTGGEMKYFTFTPITGGKYVIYSTGSDDTKVYLYNASGTELDSDDDGGDGNNFRLEYNLTAGTQYTFGVKYYSSSKTGTISFKFGNVYTVTYNANGGSGIPSAQSKDYGTSITLSSTTPTRTGYTFLGWATSSTATSATYQAGSSFSSNANTTFYAVWKANTYTISYNANGGSGAPSNQTKTHSVNLTLSSTKPTRAGYTFLGWATSSTATSATYQPGGSFTGNANTTLYAVWKQGCDNGTHTYNYTATKAPTISATGTLTGTCSKCSGTTTVTLPKLNTTDFNYSVRTAATCTVAGSGRYTWKTTTYGSFYFDVSISATGHNYSNGNCTRCGAADPNYVIDQNAARIDVENVEARVGETISVKISLKNNPGIVSIKLAVLYDSELLELVSAEGGVLENLSFGPSSNNPFTVNWVDTIHPNNTTDGVVATLTFKIKDTAAAGVTSISISYDPDDVYNLDYENVKFLTSDGVVNIVEYIPGDISGDGKINNKDLGILMQWLNGYDVFVDELAADVNRDGKLNNKDYGILMQYLNGWDVTLK